METRPFQRWSDEGSAGRQDTHSPLDWLETEDREAYARCLRDLIALSTLPAVWNGAQPVRIAESLASSLFTTLNPAFVHVLLAGGSVGAGLSITQTGRYRTDPELGTSIAAQVEEWVRTHDPDELLLLPDPREASAELAVTTRPIGHLAELGLIAVGFAGARQPSGIEQLLLDVAATQTVTAVQNANLLHSLKESQERLSAALAGSGAGTFRWEIRSGKVDSDENLNRLFGLAPDRGIRSLDEFVASIHPEDRTGVTERCERCARDGADFEMEFRVTWPDGTVRWLYDKGKTFAGADGSPSYLTGVCVDITERKQAEQALHETTRRLDAILNNTTMAVFMMDERQHCVYMNEAAERLTGYTLPETRGRPLHDVIHHSYPDGHPFPLEECAIDRALPEENQVQGEEMFVHKDGSFYPVAFTASPIRNGTGNAVGTVIEVRNIEKELRTREALERFNETLKQRVEEAIAGREKIEAQLRQAQKMEAIGKLTGGVAHDFNNLLQVIGGNLQLLARGLEGDARARQRVATAQAAVERGAKLASQLLAFGRRQPLAPKVVNLGRLVRGVDEMLRRTLGEGVEVETVVSGGLWNAFVDTLQMENALLNLAINARDAMAGHGKLTIEVGNAFLDDEYVARQPEVTPGQFVMVAVTDTGCGIDPELLERVFDPFFSTKPEGHGTGLGLSMVYGFVKQSGGHIKIYSEPGEGTTVRLYFPRTHEQEDVETEIETSPASGGTETVLVVEDDEDVRATVVSMLSDLGYRVLKAKDAASALAIFESGAAIDIVFSDVVMPGPVRSTELARKVRERMPATAILFTSGYTENSVVHGGRVDEDIDLLSKPYTREALARKLRQCLRKQKARNSRAAVTLDASRDREPGDGQRGLRILLVEDEALIRLSTFEMLQDLGHSILEAADASEALALLDGNHVDVLVTDIGLPGLSGDALAQQALTLRPHLKVVFTSGYATTGEVPGGQGNPAVRIVLKPYTQDALEAALRSLFRDGSAEEGMQSH